MENLARLFAALSSVAALLPTGPLLADLALPRTAKAMSDGTEVVISNTRREEFVSVVNGHRYSIMVALPFEPAPDKGYAVLYVLDGYWFFASAAEVARPRYPTGVVVVGIGYPNDSAYFQQVLTRRGPPAPGLTHLTPERLAPFLERFYDLTLPTSDKALADQTVPGVPQERRENVGGLDDFLKVIEADVKPRVEALAPIDTSNQALFGHSLGGLAVLHALFVEPNAFRTFLISSPSIWWNNRQVLADEQGFIAAIRSDRASPRVFVSVGSEEDFVPKTVPPSWGVTRANVVIGSRRSRMVKNVAELAVRLKAVHGSTAYVVDNADFAKVDHDTAPWAALARGIPFAFAADK